MLYYKRPSFAIIYVYITLLFVGLAAWIVSAFFEPATDLAGNAIRLIWWLVLLLLIVISCLRNPSSRVVVILVNYASVVFLLVRSSMDPGAIGDVPAALWGLFWGTYFWLSKASRIYYKSLNLATLP